MQTQPYPLVDADFGHYLAGLIDGEGCFSIHPNGTTWVAHFYLNLRSDDRPILEEIRRRTGLGTLYTLKRARESHGHCVGWNIFRKAEALQLVRLLEQFPLRAKKARDLEVWREAVIYINRFCRQGMPVDRSLLARLAADLRAGRAYESGVEFVADEPIPSLFNPDAFAA